MTIQPKYHWQFNERKGRGAHDAIGGVKASLAKAELNGHGRIGNAIHLLKKDSHINLGKEVGQFGTSDFTVAFGMKNISNHGDGQLDIIGDQTMQGHGNFFSVRLSDKRRIFFHVDENSKGKHYVKVQTDPLSMVYDRTWFHVAVVRKGRTIKIYIDGVLAAEAESKTGVVNINNNVDVKLGHSRRGTPTAQYDDLRIYHAALTTEQIQALIPPTNRPLNAGEIELVATDEATILLKQDVEDLSRFSGHFKELRLGPDTGATLYKGPDFKDVAQKLYADIPDIRFTKLGDFPRSVRLWSTVGEPFTGKWIIKAPNGQFLHRGKTHLQTAPRQWSNALFTFHYDLQQGRLQLLPGTDKDNARFTLSAVETPASLFVDDSESLPGEFSLINQGADEWLELVAGNTFRWTRQKDQRAVFVRAVKFAENEGQVGELAQGEVALYEHRAYHGKTWILSDSAKDVAGEHKRFGDFGGLNDRTSSIRLGPDTGVTLFKHFNYRAAEDKREEEIEDIVKNVPDLKESQIGDDALSSIKIFRTIAAEDVFASYTTKLSQDYRLVNDKLEEFSAYRTTLRFEPGAGAIEVSATDLTTIEVDGTTYEIHEEQSATLTPNELNFIMITSEADGLNTPGLKIQTREMADNEQVVIFPNQEAHQQIAKLEDGALWNAKDAQGNLIVDRTTHSRAEVASVQNTIKRVTATVAYKDAAPAANQSGSRVLSSERVVSGDAIAQPWELKFKPEPDEGERRQIKAQSAILKSRGLVAASVAANRPDNGGIEEATVSEDDFARLLSQATSSESAPVETSGKGPQLPGATGFGSVRRIGGIKRLRIRRRIRDAFKKAKSVVVGAVKGVVHFVVKTATEVIDFVVDTVEKVGEFIEAVVEKVVNGIKKFIEFLQFLFDWGDILDTQKYLVQSINEGFDYAAQQIDALKGPVTNFMNELQDTVEEGMNTLIETLGGEPSEARKSGFKLPEAAEWFFSKLMDGSKKEDAEPTPKMTQPSGDSRLESFSFHFVTAMSDAVGAVLRGFEGLGETIAAVIANPMKPQLAVIVLVETLRDVVLQLLEAVENLTLAFLEAIAGAVEQLKKLLNAEIKIPFISKLFRLIGGGKLTILNLAGLLLAIPVTVLSKLIFGETPFKNVPSLDLSTDVSTQTNALLVAEPGAIAKSAASTDQPEDPGARERSIRSWGITALTVDAANGLINMALDMVPESADDVLEATAGFGLEIVSLVLSGFSWLASFPSSPGFPGGRPYNVAAHKVSKSENEQEYWERVMWGWRTAMYWLDVVMLMSNAIDATKGRKFNLQRLKRADEMTIGFFFTFSIVDAGLASRYLATIPKADQPGFEIANEVVSWLPNLCAPLRLGGPESSIALGAIDALAVAITTSLGMKLLSDDLAEL